MAAKGKEGLVIVAKGEVAVVPIFPKVCYSFQSGLQLIGIKPRKMVSKVDSLSGRQAETAAASAAGPSSILLNLLNHPRHQRFTAGSSSASQHAATFSPSTAKSLCVIHDSLLQSNVPLLREIIRRCAFRSEPSLVICAERRPDIFTHAIPPDFASSSEVASLMTYPPSQDGPDEDQLFAKISGDLAAARAVGQ